MRRFGDMVLVTRYADVRALLDTDPERYSHKRDQSSLQGSFAASLTAEERAAYERFAGFMDLAIQRGTPEDHARRRRVVSRAFTPRRINDLETPIQAVADRLLARLHEENVADLAAFAYELPLMAIIEMLGFPIADVQQIRAWTTAMAGQLDMPMRATLLPAARALDEFSEYIGDFVRTQQEQLTDRDVSAALLEARDEERMSQAELTTSFILLLIAGHETTSALIGSGLHALLEQREQWRRLVDDPRLVSVAVEELLRYVTPSQWTARIASRDHELGGVPVEAGAMVIVGLAAADRDPEIFVDPDDLDIGRANSRQHVAFGIGPHFCLGAAMARLEATIVLRTLGRRFPDLELASDVFSYTGPAVVRRLVSLPVSLGTERSGT